MLSKVKQLLPSLTVVQGKAVITSNLGALIESESGTIQKTGIS